MEKLGSINNSKLCLCNHVYMSDVDREVRGGCLSFERLVRNTGAVSNCGGCERVVRDYFREALLRQRLGREGQLWLPF